MQSKLRTALAEQLRDIYFAEKSLVEALPKMVEAADEEALAAAFKEHLDETKGQVERLESAFAELGLKPRSNTCEAMPGLLDESDEIISEHEAGVMRDALLIAAAQKVEHYEIATYGTLCTWADVLELDAVKNLLGDNLDEEVSADENLTRLAEEINRTAATA